jgi:Raf kinase inhibitor-like YbhB/YbcL family protein
MHTFCLTSTAFKDGTAIPREYTREGANISPPLSWQHLPAGTQALALICHDPDAPGGDWIHWVIFNLPASWSGLPEHFPRTGAGHTAVQGSNSWRTAGYDGPCPPHGQSHRYIFTLYALSRPLKLAAGVPAQQLRRALAPVCLARTELIGTFQR